MTLFSLNFGMSRPSFEGRCQKTKCKHTFTASVPPRFPSQTDRWTYRGLNAFVCNTWLSSSIFATFARISVSLASRRRCSSFIMLAFATRTPFCIAREFTAHLKESREFGQEFANLVHDGAQLCVRVRVRVCARKRQEPVPTAR